MPIKDYERRLAYYRAYWSKNPEKYEQHKINCNRNRKMRPFIKWLKSCYIEGKLDTEIICLIGRSNFKSQRIVTASELLSLIPTLRIDAIPLKVWYNNDWVIIIEDCLKAPTEAH